MMALLKYILNSLQILTVLTGVNILLFDQKKRIFKRINWLHIAVRVLHAVQLIPTLWATTVYTVLEVAMLQQLILVNLAGKHGLMFLYYTIWNVAIISKLFLNMYITFILYFRLDGMRNLLNVFVRTYDRWQRLKRSGAQMRLNWCMCGGMCGAIIYYNFGMLVPALGRYMNNYWMCGIILYLLQSVALTLACAVGVTLLHALYRAANQLSKQTFLRQELGSLLMLYEQLLQLRSKLEAYVLIFMASEIMVNISWFTMYQHFAREGQKHPLFAAFFLIFPMLFAFLTHDIFTIANSLGNHLLSCAVTAAGDGSHERITGQLFQMFQLRKLISRPNRKSGISILLLRKNFILMYIHFAWVNAMFMSTIALTLSDRQFYSVVLFF